MVFQTEPARNLGIAHHQLAAVADLGMDELQDDALVRRFLGAQLDPPRVGSMRTTLVVQVRCAGADST
jgi:hypothetical protein